MPIGEIQADQLQAFATELRRALSGREVLVSSDLRGRRYRPNTNYRARCRTRTQLSHLNQKLALQGSPWPAGVT